MIPLDRSRGFPTSADSSGVAVDRKVLKGLMRRSDRPGLVSLGGFVVFLMLCGVGVHFAMGTAWQWPMLVVYGGVLTTYTYALSHECAHGTAFRTRWLNELLFMLSSFVYLEEHLHRRYTHASHHTYTYHRGLDAQIPASFPLTFSSWIREISGYSLLRFHLESILRAATGRYTQTVRNCVPQTELPKLTRNARIYLALYIAMGFAIANGASFLLWYFVIPILVGNPINMLFNILQHLEMDENQMDLRKSTSSFATNGFARFVYMNMNYHIEHHMFPTVPFHTLPDLHEELKTQLPAPDPGFFRTNWWGLKTVIGRSLGRVPMTVLGRDVAAESIEQTAT